MYRERGANSSRGGAEHLARIHGTEEDKVNCPFYFKVGACRHGDNCSRNHHRPPFSQTIIIPHMWANPIQAVLSLGGDPSIAMENKELKEAFDEFYLEIFEEFRTYGSLEELQVCENMCDHLLGNVYVKYSDEEEAEAAIKALNGRFYAGRSLLCEFSPVTDFREARCRQFDETACDRGANCNFMHVKLPSSGLMGHLQKEFKFNCRVGYRNVGKGLRDKSPSPPARDRRRDSRDRERDRRRDSRDRQRRRSRDRRGGSRDRDRRDDRRERSGDRGDRRERSRDRDPPRNNPNSNPNPDPTN